jgi:hypothetical protein
MRPCGWSTPPPSPNPAPSMNASVLPGPRHSRSLRANKSKGPGNCCQGPCAHPVGPGLVDSLHDVIGLRAGICTEQRSALEYLRVAFLAHVLQALRAPALWCCHPGFLKPHSSPLACGRDRDAVAAAMKEIVVVCLAIDAETGAIDRASGMTAEKTKPNACPKSGGHFRDECTSAARGLCHVGAPRRRSDVTSG